MTRRPWISKKLAERRRKEYQLHLAGYTQEEIAHKVGVHRSVVSRDLQAFRDSICPGEPPDVQEAYYIQMARIDHLEHAYWKAWEESELEKETGASLHI